MKMVHLVRHIPRSFSYAVIQQFQQKVQYSTLTKGLRITAMRPLHLNKPITSRQNMPAQPPPMVAMKPQQPLNTTNQKHPSMMHMKRQHRVMKQKHPSMMHMKHQHPVMKQKHPSMTHMKHQHPVMKQKHPSMTHMKHQHRVMKHLPQRNRYKVKFKGRDEKGGGNLGDKCYCKMSDYYHTTSP